jgi:hypothetical protein
VATVIGLVVAAVFAAPEAANAATTTTFCTSGLSSGVYKHVVVPKNAVCFAEGPIVIKNGLAVLKGATFVLGSEEDPTPQGTISGGVVGLNAANIQIHFTKIYDGIDIRGGSGPFFEGSPFCDPGPPDCVTWNTIEDSLIKGDVRITGYNGFWQGFIRNNVKGSLIMRNNVVADSDGNEVVTNTISGNLVCSGNDPAPQQGDSGGSENQVGGVRTGQCAPV